MIRQFKIENFKSLQDVRLKLNSFTLLLGPNGAGKTGILQAISCLNGLMSNNFDHWLEERGTRYDDLPSLGGANKRILWQVEVELGGRQSHQSVLRYTVSVRAWRYVGVETEEVHVVADGQPEVPLLIRKGRTVQVRDERTGQLSEPREVFAQVSSMLTTLDYQRDAALYPSLLALRQFCGGIEVHKVFNVEGMRFARQKSEDVLSPSADNLQGYLAWLKAKGEPGHSRFSRSDLGCLRPNSFKPSKATVRRTEVAGTVFIKDICEVSSTAAYRGRRRQQEDRDLARLDEE